MSKSETETDVRLQVYLARCGLGSRRGCEKLIEDRRISLNGTTVTRLGEKVSAGDVVSLDGKKVVPASKKVYIALHKPRGYLCSNADPQGRPLASQLFIGAIKERLFHVGRLDFLSTGLILFTNDGEFSKLVSHPRAQIEKEYLVETARAIDDDFLNRYAHGMMVGEIVYRCKSYKLRSDHSALITLTEGKNRELRNVFTSRNIRLKRVHRTRIGPITLRGIAAGHFRRLTEREVAWFYEHANPAPPNRKKSERPRPSAPAARPPGRPTSAPAARPLERTRPSAPAARTPRRPTSRPAGRPPERAPSRPPRRPSGRAPGHR